MTNSDWRTSLGIDKRSSDISRPGKKPISDKGKIALKGFLADFMRGGEST